MKRKKKELYIMGSENQVEDCTLDISHLVDKLIMTRLRDWWSNTPISALVFKQDFYLWIVVTPESRNDLVVTPTALIKEGLEVAIWLPLNKIRNAENYLFAYLHYYFEGLKILFARHDLPVNDLEKIHQEIALEVIDNPKYAYQAQWRQVYDYVQDKVISVWR